MDSSLLHPDIQKFINANIGADISKLALQKNPFPEVNWIAILNQIAAKTKAKDKLPSFYKTENIIYPSKISVEQTGVQQKFPPHELPLLYSAFTNNFISRYG